MIQKTLMTGMLSEIADRAERMDVTSAQPKTVKEATETLSHGYCFDVRVSQPKETPYGAVCTISAIEDGVVVKGGNPTHWCLTGNNKILACGSVASSEALRPGVVWTMPETEIKIMNEG